MSLATKFGAGNPAELSAPSVNDFSRAGEGTIAARPLAHHFSPELTASALVTETFTTQNVTDWNGWDANIVLDAGRLRTVATGDYSALQSVALRDLSNSYTAIELVQAGDTAIGSAGGTLMAVASLNVNELKFECTGGFLNAIVKIGGADTLVHSAAYVPATHRWLRLRHGGSTVFWETSADGVAWAGFASRAADFAVTALMIRVMAGDWGGTAQPTFFLWDNLIAPA